MVSSVWLACLQTAVEEAWALKSVGFSHRWEGRQAKDRHKGQGLFLEDGSKDGSPVTFLA